MSLQPQGAYLHIPFCRRRCFYCDFPVYVVGDRRNGENSQFIPTYLQALEREIRLSPPIPPSAKSPLRTVFFGGGTPSLLTAAQIDRLLQTLDRQFGLDRQAEISMEIDPGTFDHQQIQGYQAAGVNRFSMGVQAWQDALLALAGRSHRVAEIEASIQILERAKVTNWSMDLISGLPQQTMADWAKSLERAITYQPTHLSVYDLIVEAGTPFARQYQPVGSPPENRSPLPDDRTAAQMYCLAQQKLIAAGYDHYEISNYGRSGQACQHNQLYWQNLSYYGFGMGAASYLAGTRFTRPRTTQAYLGWVESGSTYPEELLGDLDRFLETLMLGLRMAQGIDIAKLVAEFGPELWQRAWIKLHRHMPHWVEPLKSGEFGQLRLTDPQGFLYSNQVLADLFEIADLD
jgi:putative oxygen-independent coproporphyrinogen III oxidase